MSQWLTDGNRGCSRYYPEIMERKAENDHNGGVSESGRVEERPKTRVYGSSNINHSSSGVLNVMRKCQPHRQNAVSTPALQ